MRTHALYAVAAFALAACGQQAPADASGETAPAQTAAESVDLAAAPAGTYVTDPKHRYITFTYWHQGYSRPYLRWRDWEGVLEWNPENPEQSSISVTIDAASIDSGVDEFDDHLRSADFFDVANHPEIAFESTSVERVGPNKGKVTGELTIKGVTKPVALDVTFNKADALQDGGHKLGFSAKTTVKRSDFGVDRYVPFVGDEVEVLIEAELASR
ncbi:YceI family protein [Amphiplicatus metriothermophilus]|uniref:Polyisoprenoid-binding protein YceI n=1 Tax=Amphiplicatus metriothermophilus TaxID=1519374 RepID=A0A239PXY0_9PROT|nr:YceI family protein [Amphiplicatus metriothermophilus]MBB5519913.1 polyisoprenoid-binding protein YceI [Amphiplicatus metriothermophilus]SNT74816.1 Polyisoprenoid-binding protein YceI [Amphiplicatus metriothermophilus]